MKIVFLNVWDYSVGDALSQYLSGLAATTDIFCFQESFTTTNPIHQGMLVDYNEHSDRKFVGEKDAFSQTTFVKKGIEVLSSGTLFPDGREYGIAIYNEIKAPDGTNLYICNAHGHARPSEKLDTPERLHFSEQLIEFFEHKNAPVIIGGDFNLEATTESVSIFEKHGYKNLIKDLNIPTTRNHLVWDRYPTKMYYSDYVFVKGDITIMSFDVPNNEVSDHLPLIVDIAK